MGNGCNGCKPSENKTNIPYFVHEGEMARSNPLGMALRGLRSV